MSDTNEAVTNCYDNQFKDAQRIYRHICSGSHYTMFIAYLQSGKTGTYLELAMQMLKQNKVEKVYIICGCSEKDLREQLKRDIQECMTTYSDDEIDAAVANTSNEEAFKMFCQQKFVKQVSQKVEIIWGNDLSTRNLNDNELRQTKLIIWDEVHYAEQHGNRPAMWWKRNRLYELLHATNEEIAKDPMLNSTYLLTVSATPSAQLFNDNMNAPTEEEVPMEPTSSSDSEGDDINENALLPEELQALPEEKRHLRVVSIADPAYYGILHYFRNGQIEVAPHIGSPQFYDRVISPWIHNRRWVIIRVNNKKNKEKYHAILEQLSTEHGLGNVQYYNSSPDARFELSQFEHPPARTTIVVVDELLRMGHVLHKTYVGAVVETAKSSNATTILQSLPGRMCGYPGDEDWTDKKIFVPQKVIAQMEAYAHDIETIVSSTTMSVQTSRGGTINYHPTVPFVITPQMLNELSASDNESNDDDESSDVDSDPNWVPSLLGESILELVQDNANESEFDAILLDIANLIVNHSDRFKSHQRENWDTFLQQIRTYIAAAESTPPGETVNPRPRVRLFKRDTNRGEDTYKTEFPKLWKSVDDATKYCTLSNYYYKKGTDIPHPFVMGVVFPGYSRLEDCTSLKAGSLFIHGCTDIGQPINIAQHIVSAESKTGSEVWNPYGHGPDYVMSGGGGGGRGTSASSRRGIKRSATEEPPLDYEGTGGLTIELSMETRTNPEQMKKELKEQIRVIKNTGKAQCIRNIMFNKDCFHFKKWNVSCRGSITDILEELKQEESVDIEIHHKMKSIPSYARLEGSTNRANFTKRWKQGNMENAELGHILGLQVIPLTPPRVSTASLLVSLCDGLNSSRSLGVLCDLYEIDRIELTTSVIEELEQAEAWCLCVEKVKALRGHSCNMVQNKANAIVKKWKNAYKRHLEEGQTNTIPTLVSNSSEQDMHEEMTV